VIIFMAVYPFIIGMPQEPPPGFELPINAHLYDLLGGLGVAVVLLIFRWFYRGDSQTSNGVGQVKILFAWLLAASFGVELQLTISALNGPVPQAYFDAIPLGILSFMGLIFSVTILRHVILELRASALELAERRFQLQHLKANLENRLLEQKTALDLEVKQRLESHILAIRAELDQLQANTAGAIADRLRLAIDNVVRPLSIEIANDVAVDVESLPTIRELRKRIRRLPFITRMRRDVPLGYVFNVPLTAVFLLIFVMPTYSFLFGGVALVTVALPAAVLCLTVIWLLSRSTLRVQIPFILAGLIAIISGIITAMPFLILGALTLNGVDLGLIAYVAFAGALITVGTSITALFIETAYLNLEQAGQDNTETRKLVGYLQNQSQINRRTMAQVVHGKVQARLQAANIRLKQASEITDQLVRDVTADLDGAMLDTTETRLGRSDLSEQLGEMAAQWEGICDLSFVYEPGVIDVIDRNEIVKSSVVEIIREAVNNAVKHGAADEAEATVSLAAQGRILVVVRNAVYAADTMTGAPDTGSVQNRGYGSRMLDQITDEWSVEFADGDAILRATVTLTQ
jgi:signal transduction histidine kinase